MDCVLPDTFKELIVLTRVAIASIGCTVKPGREALTVKLETARVATIAGLTSHRGRRGQLGGQRLGSHDFGALWYYALSCSSVDMVLLLLDR